MKLAVREHEKHEIGDLLEVQAHGYESNGYDGAYVVTAVGEADPEGWRELELQPYLRCGRGLA